MDSAHQPFRVLAALTLAAALCACGGDGGDGASADGASMPAADGTPSSGSSGSTNSTGAAGSTGTSGSGGAANVGAGDGTTTSGSSGTTGSAGTGSTAPGTTTIPAAGNLQTTTPPTSYTSGSAGAGAIASLNAARQGAGAGLLVQSTQLDDGRRGDQRSPGLRRRTHRRSPACKRQLPARCCRKPDNLSAGPRRASASTADRDALLTRLTSNPAVQTSAPALSTEANLFNAAPTGPRCLVGRGLRRCRVRPRSGNHRSAPSQTSIPTGPSGR